MQLAPEAEGEGLAKVLAERDEVRIIDYTGGPGFGGWLEENGAARGQLVYTEKAGVNTIVVDSTDNLRGVLGNLAFSLTLYSGQMCTTPQNIYVPRDGIDTDEGHLSFEDFGAAARLRRWASSPATTPARSSCSAPPSTTGSAPTPRGLAALAEEAGGTVVLDSREVSHPAYPDAVVQAPRAGRAGRQPRGRLHPGVLRAGHLPHRHVRRPTSRWRSSATRCASTAR